MGIPSARLVYTKVSLYTSIPVEISLDRNLLTRHGLFIAVYIIAVDTAEYQSGLVGGARHIELVLLLVFLACLFPVRDHIDDVHTLLNKPIILVDRRDPKCPLSIPPHTQLVFIFIAIVSFLFLFLK